MDGEKTVSKHTLMVSPVTKSWRPMKGIMTELNGKLFSLVLFELLEDASIYYEYLEHPSGEIHREHTHWKDFQVIWNLDLEYLVNNYPK